jgi:hypothetical protein
MRLGFTVDVKGNVPVKVIARTFASGKALKLLNTFSHAQSDLMSITIHTQMLSIFVSNDAQHSTQAHYYIRCVNYI